MTIDVSQLVVNVEEAPEAVWCGGNGPVSRQDVLVELQVRRRLREVQEPRTPVKHHHDSTRQLIYHFLYGYIPTLGPLSHGSHLSCRKPRALWDPSPDRCKSKHATCWAVSGTARAEPISRQLLFLIWGNPCKRTCALMQLLLVIVNN